MNAFHRTFMLVALAPASAAQAGNEVVGTVELTLDGDEQSFQFMVSDDLRNGGKNHARSEK